MPSESPLSQPFGTIGELLRRHAARRPHHPALLQYERRVEYGELDRLMDRVSAALQRDGVVAGERIAICAANSIEYAAVFLGALRSGVVAALVPPTVAPEALAAMVADSGAKMLFIDDAASASMASTMGRIEARVIPMGNGESDEVLAAWIGAVESAHAEVAIPPDAAFNIIYSSGTTGDPKGIVQPHSMRWAHMQRGPAYAYDCDSITLLATPLYSNTTLVSFFPTLAMGGTVLLMGKFGASAYLALAECHRVTHTMLVPVQYQRLMALADFDRYDLASFRMKLSTSAPFAAALKREVLDRWPGALVEYYGMTEGGATCVLSAHLHPDKLHTVGRAAPGVDVRLIDEHGREVPQGESGEVVGHSAAMMTGYHNRPDESARAEWFDAEGRRYIRTGDVGHFDDDGFLTLIDRRKDLIISGGFNVYPSDLEAVLRAHTDVADVAVVGMPSRRWGETPVAFVVARPGSFPDGKAMQQWANERLGKVQRLAAVEVVAELPRNAIGKVLKRALREAFQDRFRTGY